MKNYREMLFFQPNRVWRCYRGGKLLDRLLGEKEEKDSLFPENWLGSVTRASNGDRQTSPDEGISRLRSGELLTDLLKRDGKTILGCESKDPGVLCKFLDAAVRLPFQCHPDREFARKYCGSDYGKTESWFILDTREIDGEKPYIMLGFKPGIDRKRFRDAVLAQDIPAVLSMMHRLEVHPGDKFFIPGRLPHAIGSGVLMLEVQEPTDLVIQPEEKIGDITLSYYDMWRDLTVEQGLDCFEYRGRTEEEVRKEFAISPTAKNGPVETLIDASRTDCFRVSEMKLRPGESFAYRVPSLWQLAVVAGGAGEVRTEEGLCSGIGHGDSFLIPNPVREPVFSAGKDGLDVYFIQ